MKIFKRIIQPILLLLCFLILSFSGFFFYVYSRHYVAPVAMYHLVNPQAKYENRLTVTPKSFERQLSFLKTFRYNVISLEALSKMVEEKQSIPARTVVITFDDGYKDNYTYAFPALKKYNFPATVFVIVNEVGRADRLSWDEIKEMQASGLITFGSHTLGAEPLINIKSEDDLRKEIFDSRKILQEKLGAAVNTFSYPEGRFNPHIRQLVIDAGYKTAVTTAPGRQFSDNDVFALKRLRISENAGNLFVFWLETSGIYTFIKENRDD